MKILFVGYDARYIYLINELKNRYEIDTLGYGNDVSVDNKSINNYDIVVLPMRGICNNDYVTKDLFNNYKGVIYTGLTKGLKGNVESFLDDKEIVEENTLITVDGIIDRISSINKVIICILGYGNIGSKLYDRLKDDYKVLVGVNKKYGIVGEFLTSDKKALEYRLTSSDLIINTIPNHIIDEDILNKMRGYFLDISSSPYGIDINKINKYKLKYDLYSSIPSKYAPDRAGKILLKKFGEDL